MCTGEDHPRIEQLPQISFMEAVKTVSKVIFKQSFEISHPMFACALSGRPNLVKVESWNCEGLVNTIHNRVYEV